MIMSSKSLKCKEGPNATLRLSSYTMQNVDFKCFEYLLIVKARL